MRRQLLTFLLAGLSLLAATSPARAEAMPQGRALTVSQPVSVALPLGATPVRQTQAIHNVHIGQQTLALKVRYGRHDLIDVTALEASTGMEFRRRQQFVTVDRAQSGERAELSLRTGQLLVDGRPAAWIDLAGVRTDGRLWLSPEAVSTLAGLPVSVSGRSLTRKQNVSATATIETTELLFPGNTTADAPSQASLLLAAHSQESRAGDSPRRGSLSDLSSFDGVFGGSVRRVGQPATGGDWRERESWQIESRVLIRPQTTFPPAKLVLASAMAQTSPESGKAAPGPAKSAKTASRHANIPDRTYPSLISVSSSSQHLTEAPLNNSPSDYRVPVPSLKTLAVQKADRGFPEKKAVSKPAATAVSLSAPSSGSDEAYVKQTFSKLGSAIRGTVFLDLNGNGRIDLADQRLEGEQLILINIDTGRTLEKRSAVFGQFGFADLQPGRYRLRVLAGWQEHAIELNIQPGELADEVPIAIATGPPESSAREIRSAPV